ncbi:hypothetical protein [Streptomyces sp. NPDC047990]|uniref:hypothetical protein n=1 Tax=Streptomyces sp. NPDC047990 TaxID=3365496 RepID=UPI00371C188C
MPITKSMAAVSAAALMLVGAAEAGVARASAPTAAGPASPSACRPANHTARIAPAPASSGHRHYRVTLTAARGYEPCRPAGSPTDVRFSRHGSPDAVRVGRYGPQHGVVTFGPGHPVHFDIQVPNGTAGVPADEVSFTLRTPDGVIPGESGAYGHLTVAPGTVVGPLRPGA